MNYGAVEHHAYDTYCYPVNKDELKINIKTGKDITQVFLIYGDPFCTEKVDGKWKWSSTRLELTERAEMQSHYWWQTTVVPPFKRCKYFFELRCGDETKLYFEDGFFTPEEVEQNADSHVLFIFPWMNPVDICTHPKWAEQTVWYQIFPARFCHGENPAYTKEILPWAGPDKAVDNSEQYGGNIQGIIDRLDYLEQLGINGLYLNPINLATSQHKYDTTDYLEIDPEFGTKEKLCELVKKAHSRGMRVMLDGVFNHSGWFFFAWQDVIKNRENSKYADWYMVNDFSFKDRPCDNSAKGKYFAFAFADPMPKLNTNNPQVRDYICKVCETWVKEYDIDAIRLDVANEISHVLCNELRTRMHALKDDFFIVGEIWNHAMPWLRGDQFDSVINYPLRTAIMDFALIPGTTTHILEQQINHCLHMYYSQTERVLLNQLDSHDTVRLVTKTGDKDLTMLQFALLFMFPGSTCIYYGTEVLLEGEHDPDCRRCMPWDGIEAGTYKEELAFMKGLISLRRKHPAITANKTEFVYKDEDSANAGESRVVRIIKTDEKSGERVAGIFNFGNKACAASLSQKDTVLSKRYFNGASVEAKGFVIYTME